MKRFACHRLYVFSDGCYSNYVVELNEEDKVRTYFPLEEEISATQWIGGVIVLSPLLDIEIGQKENFHSFLEKAVGDTDKALYAWHLVGFDLMKGEFTPQTRLVRLR